MKEALLEAKDVSKCFLNGTVKELVLKEVNLEIYDGDFTVIMGPSGAGKSTLLYTLSGMDTITEGQIVYKGRDISKLNEKQMAELRVKEFGFVFQQANLVSNLTLFENLVIAGYLKQKGRRKEQAVKERAQMLLTQMHIEKAKNRMPSEASGGEAQRAAIARAVMNQPCITFADEPTGALNKRNTEEVLQLLTNLNHNGQNIVMVTHDIRAAVCGTRLLYMEDGRILDELSMPPFLETHTKDRETKVNRWLASLAW